MKFYVTGLYLTAEFNDSTLPPIEIEAESRLDVLLNLGLTIWTEEAFWAFHEKVGGLAPIPSHYQEAKKETQRMVEAERQRQTPLGHL